MIAQLPLGFQLRDDATFDSFFPGENGQAYWDVRNMSQNLGEQFLYVWGPEGSGRTHLLQAACHAISDICQSGVYIPLDGSIPLVPELFQGLENLNLICIDDIDEIAGNQRWEEQLFHLFNRVRASGGRLIISSKSSPTQLKIKLPDLKSRLAWGVAYQLHPLTDEEKLSAIVLRAQCRGLALDEAVGRFLIRRCPRDMARLFETLEQLDQASFTEQRRLTIPFVKQVLGF